MCGTDKIVSNIIGELQKDGASLLDYTLNEGVLLYKGRLVVPNNEELKFKILAYLHDDSISGHVGLAKTVSKAYIEVFWPGLKRVIRSYIQSCSILPGMQVQSRETNGFATTPTYS